MACKWMHALPRKIVLTYALERPNPLELISVDGVGPRQCQGSQKYYIAIIDHASRFMVTSASDVPITSETLKERWLATFVRLSFASVPFF